MATFRDLVAEVALIRGIGPSIKGFINGLKQRLEELKDAPTSNDIQAEIDNLESFKAELAEAITTEPPAEEPAPPAEEPVVA